MTSSAAEQNVAAAFAELAETLAADLDVTQYLTAVCRHGVELTGARAAAIICSPEPGVPGTVAASDPRARRLAAAHGDRTGPWARCMATGEPFTIANLSPGAEPWPGFAADAAASGMTTATFLPLGTRPASVAGALALLGGEAPDLASVPLAMALADAAGAGILLAGELHRQQVTVAQLQAALSSRIIIEQAKGVLAERWQVPPDVAFQHLRRHARRAQRRLADLALDVVQGSADLSLGQASRK